MSEQLSLDFTVNAVNNVSGHMQIQRNCMVGTRYDKPMQAFIDWWITYKETEVRHWYRPSPDIKIMGFFECYFVSRSGGLLGIDGRIPEKIVTGLGMVEINT